MFYSYFERKNGKVLAFNILELRNKRLPLIITARKFQNFKFLKFLFTSLLKAEKKLKVFC